MVMAFADELSFHVDDDGAVGQRFWYAIKADKHLIFPRSPLSMPAQ
jgi:hypothetical protein